MFNHRLITIMALTAIAIILSSAAFGQIIHGQQASGSMRTIYSKWSVETDSVTTDISQFMIPVSVFVPLQENLEMRFFGSANNTNRVETQGQDFKLAGLSDVRLQLNQSLSEDRILLSLGANLPTGKKELSRDEERVVMAVLTENYLSFPIRRLGEGFGVNALVGGATMINDIRYGGSIMYQINGAYQAYEDGGDYKPGNLISISASADTRREDISLLGEITFSAHSVDKVDDRKVFKQSSQFDLHAGIGYHQESYIITGDLRYLLRDRNTRYDSLEVVYDQLKIYGNEFSFVGRMAYSLGPERYIAPMAEIRLMNGNEFEDDNPEKVGSSNNIGFGLEYGQRLGEMLNGTIGFKYYTGSADGGNIDLSGYRISVGIQSAF